MVPAIIGPRHSPLVLPALGPAVPPRPQGLDDEGHLPSATQELYFDLIFVAAVVNLGNSQNPRLRAPHHRLAHAHIRVLLLPLVEY